MILLKLLQAFREYERYYTADQHDSLEWRRDFLEFVLWLADKADKSEVL